MADWPTWLAAFGLARVPQPNAQADERLSLLTPRGRRAALLYGLLHPSSTALECVEAGERAQRG